MAHDDTYAWLDPEQTAEWCGLDLADDDTRAAKFELARKGAAEWCEDKRKDLLNEAGAFVPGPRVVIAGMIATARLCASPGAFQEMGAGALLDPDRMVLSYLGTNRRPALG